MLVGVSRTKMIGFEKQKILRNLVKLENCLVLDDDFLELSLQRKIFSLEMLNSIIGTDSPSLDYCMKLMRCESNAFTQFIDILIVEGGVLLPYEPRGLWSK